jgi:UDP-glucuronate 4-epimerase
VIGFLIAALLLGCLSSSLAQAQADNDDPPDYLSESSVILITGAAGFLGSELALALYRTYAPKKILCVDRMGDHPSSQEELALFEFQRQRAFHVLQTLGSHGRFYRVDFRPMLPEYFDLGEVPVLDHIFREHSDITHIVHLADPFPHSALQAVPREKEVPKAGMMEALMEQMAKVKRDGGRVPHFTYASSYEVYPYKHATNATMSPLTETQPIQTPSSLRGASKLIDEFLAKLYHDQQGLYSVGLRFFPVYGPWSVPGSPMFELAERAVTDDLPLWDPQWKSIKDYVYIDDAMDAMMAAMQFRPAGEQPHPVVINVASGQGTSLQEVAQLMEDYFPRKTKSNSSSNNEERTASDEKKEDPFTASFGSIERAEQLLGYKPRVTLKEGIVQLLAWHYDRAYPYGGGQTPAHEKSNFIASKGIVSCLSNDKECLKAAPVFPCASECSHEAQCTQSFYDEIMGWTQALTANCETLLYTLDLDDSLLSLPSAHLKIQTTSKSFVDGNCNLAFVSESSPLVKSLRNSNRMSAFMGSGRDKLLKNGEWILIPVNAPSYTSEHDAILKLLPKLSPGLFFGSATKRAIYIDPDILLDSIPKLLLEAAVQPYNEEREGATTMLIGKGKPKDYFAQGEDDFTPKKQTLASAQTVVQNAAYRMVRIAVSDKLFGDGMELLDSRWMVHTLQSDDSRLFRCDVFGEVVQWQADTDRPALEFVLGLHDMWSRVIATESGLGPWWIGESVVTVPEGHILRRRRLEEVDAPEGEDEKDKSEDESEDDDESEEQAEDEKEQADDDNGVGADNDDKTSQKGDAGAASKTEDTRTGFAIQAEGVQEVNTAGDKKRGGSSDQDDDQVEEHVEVVEEPEEAETVSERDFSSYDTWMGVLSASSVKYFVRIVPSSEVGVVSLDDYKKENL